MVDMQRKTHTQGYKRNAKLAYSFTSTEKSIYMLKSWQ